MAAQSQSLKFKQPLLKVASNSELTKRLRALHDELRDFDQDLIDPSSLDKVARELIHTSLLLHKDKAVKAFAGCCLVDILRLYAPEAPYTQAELHGLFEFLVHQFKKVGDPKDPHQSEYYYIVDSLATVKSIVLVCDLESGSEQLVEQIFTQCFESISSSSPKNVEIALSDVLLSLIEELPSLSHQVVRILVSFFQPKTQRSKPAAADLAIEVCRGASDKLQRYVSQYFAEVIQAAIEGKQDSEEEDSDDSEDERSRRKRRGAKGKTNVKGKGKGPSAFEGDDLPVALVDAHEIIECLNRHVPALLLNVIPLLSSELTSTTSPKYRRLATTCLGDMFANKRGAGDLAASFPLVWKEWTKRTADVSPLVRIAVAASLRKIWTRHAELGPDIEDILRKLLGDSDEKVRIAACQTFESMDYETACHHVSINMLKALGERTVDRKEKVRQSAYRTLGRLFNLAYSELEAREDQALEQFGWIPGILLDGLAYSDGSSATGASAAQIHLVDQTFADYVVPRPSAESSLTEDIPSWVDRFLHVDQLLQDSSSQRHALFSLTRLHEGRGGSVWEAYLQTCEAYNGGIIDNKEKEAGIKDFLNKTIKAIAGRMPDSVKASADLKTFAKQNVGQLYRELKVLLDPQTDLKNFIKNEKDLLRRLEKMSDSMASTFSSFIHLSCYTIINRSSIPQLVKRLTPAASTSEAVDLSASAQRTLKFVAKTRPILFKSHVAELTKVVTASEKDSNTEISESATETALHALAKLKTVDASFTLDSRLSKQAVRFAKEAKTVGHAKYAATLVALDRPRTGTADDLVEFLADALPDDPPEDLVPHLASLARVAKYGHDSFEQKSEQVTVECLEILKRATRAAEMPQEDGATWIEDSDLHPLTSARILALKVLTNRCIPFAKTESSATVASPVFGLLWRLLESGRDTDEETVVSSRLRLASTLGVLKLLTTKDPVFLKSAIQNFALLSQTAQDTCFEVRDGYLRKLLHYLRLNRLHSAVLPLFHMSLFLIAHEPDEDLRSQVVQFIRKRSRHPDCHSSWELPCVRLLSLLAHHPDFEGEHSIEEYRLMAKYIELYLDCIATSENISLLYHLAQLVKGGRDAVSSAFDNNLYALSELAQYLIKGFAERHSWPLTTLPKRQVTIKLPGDAFKTISDPVKAKAIGKTVYLADDVLKELETKEKKVSAPRKRKATASGKESPKKKRAPTSGAKKSSKKRKSGQEWDSSESEASEASETDSDEDDDRREPEGNGGAKGNVKAKKRQANKTDPPKTPLRKGLRGRDARKSMKEVDEDEGEEEEDDDGERSNVESDKVDGRNGGATSDADAMSVDEASEETESRSKSKKAQKKVVKPKSPAKKKKKEEPKSRRALRGLAQPRKIQKKGTFEEVSDVADSDSPDDDEEDAD